MNRTPRNHSDFSAVGVKASASNRIIAWFIRGRSANGRRWESSVRHKTRELAEVELQQRRAEEPNADWISIWQERSYK
jgi:hypothetical protein